MKTLLVLNALYYSKDGMTQKEITERTFQSKQTVNLIIKNLLADGYVTVKENPENRRNKFVALTDSGIRTTCFISPIFPGITDVPAIIDRVKDQCQLIWLENLNLRGSYKAVIMDSIKEKHPELLPLYMEIYTNGSRLYWESLDSEIREYANHSGLEYVRDDDSMKKPFDAPPTIVNFFYHEEIKKSAKKQNKGEI